MAAHQLGLVAGGRRRGRRRRRRRRRDDVAAVDRLPDAAAVDLLGDVDGLLLLDGDVHDVAVGQLDLQVVAAVRHLRQLQVAPFRSLQTKRWVNSNSINQNGPKKQLSKPLLNNLPLYGSVFHEKKTKAERKLETISSESLFLGVPRYWNTVDRMERRNSLHLFVVQSVVLLFRTFGHEVVEGPQFVFGEDPVERFAHADHDHQLETKPEAKREINGWKGGEDKKKTYHQREGDGDGVDGFDQPQNDETGELDEREEVHAARLHLRKKTKQNSDFRFAIEINLSKLDR